MSEFEGWQIRAGRAAAGLTYADVLKATGVAVSMQQRIEAYDLIRTRVAGERKEAGTIDAEAIERIVSLIEKKGFRLVAAGRTAPRVERIA